MRPVSWIVLGFSGWLGSAAQAAEAPAIVIPGKAGVPVIINGADVSYCVVEGDYGLDRPNAAPLTVYACPFSYRPLYGVPRYGVREPAYYPAFGRRPGYGRYEIEPPPGRRLPPPAQPYHREWGVQSMELPASLDQPAAMNIDVAPQIYGGPRRYDRYAGDADRPGVRHTDNGRRRPARGGQRRPHPR